jgi:predicted membrane protein
METTNLLKGFDFDNMVTMYYILMAIVHLAFAAAVAKDAGRLLSSRGSTILVGPVMWSFATIIGGVWVAAVFWLLHHLPILQQSNYREKNEN